MSDLISRQEALEVVAKVKNNMNIGDITHYTFDLIDAISNLPSAEPKKGKWVDAEFESETIDGVKTMVIAFGCNQCGWLNPYGNHYNYCPSCGADMREEQNHELDNSP